MYRGMIEGAEWAKEGTYLRQKIKQYQLDKVTGHGRIWRLTYDGIARDRTQPRMLTETPGQLVAHLSHPNGWWRDTAQQLLVLKQDKSVVPALGSLVRSSTNLLARFHALWTLEGLGALDAAQTRELLRIREPRDADSGDCAPARRCTRQETRRSPPTTGTLVERRQRRRRHPGDFDDERAEGRRRRRPSSRRRSTRTRRAASSSWADRFSIRPTAAAAAAARRRAAQSRAAESLDRGGTIYTELCFCVPRRRRARHADARGCRGCRPLAPSFAGSPRVIGHRDYAIKVLLHGLSGPIDGRRYPQVMVAMGSNKDQWIADSPLSCATASGIPGRWSRRRRREGPRRWAIARRHGRLRSSRLRCRARSDAGWHLEDDGQPRRAAGTASECRRRLQLPQRRRRRCRLSSAGPPACHNRPACGSRSSCRPRSC